MRNLILIALMILISACSTVTKIKPSPVLMVPCDDQLPDLEDGSRRGILGWRVEAGDVYRECRDKHKHLSEAVGG